MQTVELSGVGAGLFVGVVVGALMIAGAVHTFARLRRGEVIEQRVTGGGLLGALLVRGIAGGRVGYGQTGCGAILGVAVATFALWGYAEGATTLSVDAAGVVHLGYPFPRSSKAIPGATVSELDLLTDGRSARLRIVTAGGRRYTTFDGSRHEVVAAAAQLRSALGGRVPVMECPASPRGAACAASVDRELAPPRRRVPLRR